MKLELAILTILSRAPKAINAQVILGFVPAFLGRDATLSDVIAALKAMETDGHVKGTDNKYLGTLWKETDDGRLQIP